MAITACWVMGDPTAIICRGCGRARGKGGSRWRDRISAEQHPQKMMQMQQTQQKIIEVTTRIGNNISPMPLIMFPINFFRQNLFQICICLKLKYQIIKMAWCQLITPHTLHCDQIGCHLPFCFQPKPTKSC